MDFVTVLFVALLTILVLQFLRPAIRQWRYFKKVRNLPKATKFNPIFGHALEVLVPLSGLPEKLINIVANSPPFFVFWLGPIPILMLIQPEHIKEILSSPKYIDKPMQYSFLHPWLGTGLLTSTGSKWLSHRKMITPTFHFKILENFVEVFAEKSQILVKKLEKELGSKEFDVCPYITMCALDIICETAMGIEINAQSQEGQSDYVNAVCRITGEIMERILHPWLYPNFLYKLTSNGKKLNNYVTTLHNLTNKIIRERKELYRQVKNEKSSEESISFGMKKKLAFLDLLLEISENGAKLTDEEIREEVDTFMFEGHDTTAAAISWSLQLLAAHPEAQDKAYQEIKNIFGDTDRSPTMNDLSEMKYLERVIKEALRLYPSVPMIGRELKQDVEIDGFNVPAGVKVAIMPYFTHRMEEHFPNPEEFDPDNFLPERIAARHPYAYIPFSAGPRNCIGQKFAILEEKMVLSYILRHYKLEITEKIADPIPELILRPDNGIHLTITKRAIVS